MCTMQASSTAVKPDRNVMAIQTFVGEALLSQNNAMESSSGDGGEEGNIRVSSCSSQSLSSHGSIEMIANLVLFIIFSPGAFSSEVTRYTGRHRRQRPWPHCGLDAK
jgi:hypothetical protein